MELSKKWEYPVIRFRNALCRILEPDHDIALIPAEVIQGAHNLAYSFPGGVEILVAVVGTVAGANRYAYFDPRVEYELKERNYFPVLRVCTGATIERCKEAERRWKEGEATLRSRTPAGVLSFITDPTADPAVMEEP